MDNQDDSSLRGIERESMAPPGWESAVGAEEFVEAEDQWRRIGVALREILETIVLTVLIFLLIRTVVQNFRIEGYSMEPTLHSGQYLIVDKLSYRIGGPERGDIIVFEFQGARERDFIKRIVGLPGEKVEIMDGQVFVNDVPLEEPYVQESPRYSYGPEVLNDDEYFVLGDNRNNSRDSHSWGPLSRDDIVGQALISYWPPEHWGLISEPRYFLAGITTVFTAEMHRHPSRFSSSAPRSGKALSSTVRPESTCRKTHATIVGKEQIAYA